MASSQEVDRSPIEEQIAKKRKDITKSLGDLSVFWRTRNAVLRGDALWILTDEDRLKAGYCGPWKFNALQTAFAGSFGAIVAKTTDALIPQPENFKATPAFPSDPAFSKVFEGAFDWLAPFIAPTFLLLFAASIAWGSLRSVDSTPASRARARSAYLYLDGALGFWIESLIAVVAGIATAKSGGYLMSRLLGPALPLSAAVVFLFLWIWQVRVTMKQIPERMFLANGYSTRRRRLWQPRLGNDPPWARMLLAGGISVVPIGFGLVTAWFGIAYAFAFTVVWARGLLS